MFSIDKFLSKPTVDKAFDATYKTKSGETIKLALRPLDVIDMTKYDEIADMKFSNAESLLFMLSRGVVSEKTREPIGEDAARRFCDAYEEIVVEVFKDIYDATLKDAEARREVEEELKKKSRGKKTSTTSDGGDIGELTA